MISFRETKGYPYSYMRVYDVRTRRDANLVDPTVVLGTCVDIFHMMVSLRRKVTVKNETLQIFYSPLFFKF